MAAEKRDKPGRGRDGIPVTLELLEEVAREFYVGNKAQKLIADILERRHRRRVGAYTVSRWLLQARDEGIVSFVFDPNFGISGTESRPESLNMMQAFGLEQCDAVRINHPGAGRPTLTDTTLHIGLANFAGRRLEQSFRAGEVIGVGGGRAVHRFATYLARRAPRRLGVRIVPLSGRIWSGSWVLPSETATGGSAGGGLLERPLDADDAANVLASAYEGGDTTFSQIGFPLYADGDAQAREIKLGHCAALPGGKWNFGLRAPDWAVLGIGIFDNRTGHRVRIFLDTFKNTKAASKDAPYLARARDDLDVALRVTQKAGLPFFGDLGNRLFPCLPPPEGSLHERTARKWESALVRVARVLERINRKAIVAEWSHLRQVRHVKVIAGGAEKIPALWTLLIASRLGLPPASGRQALVNELTVDQDTAIQLLAHKRQYDMSREWQDWYRRVATKAGLFAR